MVFADTEHVEADLVGELDLLHQVAQAFTGAGTWRHFSERIDSEFHRSAERLDGRRPADQFVEHHLRRLVMSLVGGEDAVGD